MHATAKSQWPAGAQAVSLQPQRAGSIYANHEEACSGALCAFLMVSCTSLAVGRRSAFLLMHCASVNTQSGAHAWTQAEGGIGHAHLQPVVHRQQAESLTALKFQTTKPSSPQQATGIEPWHCSATVAALLL